MKIGNIELKHGIFLAPMAGVTDIASRKIYKKYGVEYMTTEMVSAAAMHYGDKKTYEIAKLSKEEFPCAVQIFGHDPDMMAEAALALSRLETPPCAIDINMGCPVKKIVSGNDGSAIMKSPLLAGRIVEKAVSACNIPVTVKIRAGYERNNKNAVEIAKTAESAGASAVCVHGRTREDMYIDGTVDYDIIAEVKSALKIPVIANGDIMCADDFIRIVEYTKCDGGAVGRGALGNPFIFEEIKARLDGVSYTPPTAEERLIAAGVHMRALVDEKGQLGVFESRKHAGWYTKGIRGGSSVREKINRADTAEEIEKILADAISRIKGGNNPTEGKFNESDRI